MAISSEQGVEALNRLRSTEPPLWLAPSTSLAEAARAASQHLFYVLRPHAPKSPFDELLINGFDAEQIWQQIDLQSQPLLSGLRRDIRKYEKNPEEIAKIGKVVDDEDGMDVEDSYDDYEEDEVGEGEDNEGGEETESEEGGSDEGEQENGKGGVIEDGFLKIKELEEFMVEDEAREYGLETEKKKKNKKKKSVHDSDEEEEEDKGEKQKRKDDAEEEDDEIDFFGYGGDEDDGLDNARYEDFFGSKKNKVSKQKSKPIEVSGEDEDEDSDDGQDEDERNDNLSTHDGSKELSDSDDGQDKDAVVENKRNNNLSTHEKQLKKLRSEIEKNEKANLEPKTWTMQGEVTAAKRPKNSALEVDLDFEHNLRPAPVITEEVTASLEEIIQKRILEERFDDVQKVPSFLVKAPRELKELDENKSKRGLAEVYEEEFVQKTDPASAPLSFSDEQKNEARTLFKKICLKLDALSHFHFAPKPVIEDMSIQANVPALAMEEIAPMAISDAAMLAPEEVFGGKGDIKEEAELTQAERKRRRANKKRKFKSEAAKRPAKKTRESTLQNHNGKEEQ
ncbi:U3 small nucleolar ribonucleoprotein protein MPP10-like [Tripterygium wilfordii]|uniref:U3 small nucleolar ribonucleoprotein protein MPP10-like n=1 Tax=Tripterygium wilfordii TaxID=458696 RepID=UPI0018F82EB7|nr:U3 small nucleolar ribonucleoprotein protein MPP10-like [Tripterygium wilfordii]